jgi:hypothetical protein
MTEAPLSGNIRLFYKGYSIQITNRDPSVEVKPLIQKMMQIAEFADKNGCAPSEEKPSRGFKKSASPTQSVGSGIFCKKHNVEMRPNKNGNLYHRDINRPEGTQFCNGRGFPDEETLDSYFDHA